MLGEFTISSGTHAVGDGDDRSRKVWLLLTYLVFCRNRCVSRDELINLLWGSLESNPNPFNALKAILHRARAVLNRLEPGAGNELILRRMDSYTWNSKYPLECDADAFENYCLAAAAAEDPDKQLENYLRALELYRGDFLPKLADEPWVSPVGTYLHNLFLQALSEAIPQLEQKGRLDEAISVCRRAVQAAPCEEYPARYLIRALLEQGRQQDALAAYEDISRQVSSQCGLLPSGWMKSLYREAVSSVSEHRLSPETVQEQLREPDGAEGALICDYDFFKVISHAEARAMARSGEAAHIGLLTISGTGSRPLSKRSMDSCLKNLEIQIRTNLRRGDVAARCGPAQYILLLPRANYESSLKVTDRIIRAYFRQHPHSPAELRAQVQPLEPNI